MPLLREPEELGFVSDQPRVRPTDLGQNGSALQDVWDLALRLGVRVNRVSGLRRTWAVMDALKGEHGAQPCPAHFPSFASMGNPRTGQRGQIWIPEGDDPAWGPLA